jgi:hypothetical protein
MINERVVITWIDEPKLFDRVFRKKEMRCGVIRESFPSLETAVVFMTEVYGVSPKTWVINQKGDTLSASKDLRPMGGDKSIRFTITNLVVSDEMLDEPLGIDLTF